MAALPPTLKAVNSFLKLAKDYDKKDPTVAYFCRMYAVQKGIKLDSKSPEGKNFLFGLMDQLENTKKELMARGDESVTNDIVGQAHLENVTVSLFTGADTDDRNGIFNKNMVKKFYSASLLYEVMTQFGELSEECAVQQKYSKWKATEIHKCMQRGETPQAGPAGSEFEDADFTSASTGGITSGMNDMQMPPYDTPSQPQPQPPPPSYGYQQPPPPTNQPTPAPRRPSTEASASNYVPVPAAVSTSADVDFEAASKLCKYAMSALQYEDVDTAITNLTQALTMLHAAKR